jgi:hypothetical protein
VRQRLGLAGTILFFVLASVGLFVTDILWKRVPTARVMTSFLAAVRSGHLEEALPLATPTYQRFLAPPGRGTPGTEQGRTLAMLRAAADVRTDTFIGEWTEGCIYGSADRRPFAAVLVRTAGAWRIDDIRSEVEPELCKEMGKPEGD